MTPNLKIPILFLPKKTPSQKPNKKQTTEHHSLTAQCIAEYWLFVLVMACLTGQLWLTDIDVMSLPRK
jgi:hypothetical protein